METDIKKPPAFARWLLHRMKKYQEEHSITGDVEEVYYQLYQDHGHSKARNWYWHQSIMSYFRYLHYLYNWRAAMLKNYITIAYRNFFQHKGITLVNIAGLTIGLASFLIITMYVRFEKSYDGFHNNSQNIYRIQYNLYRQGEKQFSSASAVPAIGPALKNNFPEVTEYSRATRSYLEYCALTYNQDVSFRENRVFVVTPSFLEMFNFPLIKGDKPTALSGPLKAVLTSSTAAKFFADEDAVGKQIIYNTKQDHDFEISGVCEDVPINSHIKFDVLFSYNSLPYIAPISPDSKEGENDWWWTGFYTYITLEPDTDPLEFQTKMNKWLEKIRAEDWNKNERRQEFLLQPLEDIHLLSNLANELEPNEQGNAAAVKVLSFIAYLLLGLAWMNYINISASRAIERAKEVGIRKISGAYRQELVKQFFLEFLLINIIAGFLAMLILLNALPFFNQLLGRELSFSLIFQSFFWIKLLLLLLVGTMFAGLYPAVILSSFRPAAFLKGTVKKSQGSIRVRKLLVTLQLAFSVAMIAGTFIINKQISFMLKKDLGMNLEQTLVLHAPGVNEAPPPVFSKNIEAFRTEVKKQNRVLSLTTSTSVPGEEILWGNAIRRQADHVSRSTSIDLVGIDFDYISAFKMELQAGRNFSREFPSDEKTVILNNETVRLLGYLRPEVAVDQKIVMRNREWRVIGVLNDINQMSLKKPAAPLVYLLSPNRGYISIKLKTEKLYPVLAWLRATWKEYFAGLPFDYFFLDEYYNRHYINDQQFGKVFFLFSLLAVLIASLGLFSLASLNASQRLREIGIRKALGASIRDIIFLLSKDFLKLLTIAGVIALPLIYYQMNRWLDNFASRIRIDWWLFPVSWLIVFALVIFTVSYQTYKAAITNPVESLRNE